MPRNALPIDRDERKAIPLASGVIDYFPSALIAVAKLSAAGNSQHHPGEALHWDRSKSSDHPDALMRHFFERGSLDSDGQRHSAKVAWRALALLQEEIERDEGVPMPRNARLPESVADAKPVEAQVIPHNMAALMARDGVEDLRLPVTQDEE